VALRVNSSIWKNRPRSNPTVYRQLLMTCTFSYNGHDINSSKYRYILDQRTFVHIHSFTFSINTKMNIRVPFISNLNTAPK